MSNRRKPKSQRHQQQSRRQSERQVERLAPAVGEELEGLEPWLWAMQDADEAERRGDAAAALAALNRRLVGPDGRVYWRPSRLRWLEQMVMLGPAMPGWVRSRWILAQSLQWLDERDRGPAGRRARATKVVVEIHGGLHRIWGTDMDDRRMQLIDHDWIYRQVFLYEEEGLRRFLRAGAAPDLVAGADGIQEWAHAPMGGFRYLGVEGDSLCWTRAGTVVSVLTPNIGTAIELEPGDHVLGRLVPVEGGSMFDGTVLPVPAEVARDVEADPAAWIRVLRGAGHHLRSGAIKPRQGAWRALLSDVSMSMTDLMLLRDERPDPDEAARLLPADKACAVLDIADGIRLRGMIAEVLARNGEDAVELDDAHAVEAAIVHATLTEPAVVQALADVAGPGDRYVLEDLVPLLAEPARSVVVSVIDGLDIIDDERPAGSAA